MWQRLRGDDKGWSASGGKGRLPGSLFPGRNSWELRQDTGSATPSPTVALGAEGVLCARGRVSGPLLPANSLSQPIPLGQSDPSTDPTAQSSGDRREEKSPLCSPSDQNILSGEDTALCWLSKAVLGPWFLGSHRDMGGIDPCPLISPDKNLETTRLNEHSCSKPHKDPVSRACWSDGSPTWLKRP